MKRTSSILFTLDQIKKLPCAARNMELIESLDKKVKKKKGIPAGKIVTKLYQTSSIEKNFIEEVLFNWASQKGLVLYAEYRFHDTRRWRFDWCVPDIKLAVEYEGIFSEHSRHTNVIGFSNDTEKYRQAALLGYTVLRYTALNYKNLLTDLQKYNSNDKTII